MLVHNLPVVLAFLDPPHIAILLLLALLLFGAKNLPQMGRSIGQGMREFKKGISGIADDESSDTEKKTTP